MMESSQAITTMKFNSVILLLLSGLISQVISANQHTLLIGYSRSNFGYPQNSSDGLAKKAANYIYTGYYTEVPFTNHCTPIQKFDTDSAQGLAANYLYKIDNLWGVMGHFTWLRTKNSVQATISKEIMVTELLKHPHIKTRAAAEFVAGFGTFGDKTGNFARIKIGSFFAQVDTLIRLNSYSTLVGPTWCFNEYISIYGVAGINIVHDKTTSRRVQDFSEPINKSSTTKNQTSDTYFGLALGTGVQINPTKSIAITAGYETAFFNEKSALKAPNTVNISLGYRF